MTETEIGHVTITTEEPDFVSRQQRKPINVKRIVLIVLLSIAFICALITTCFFGIGIGIATLCSFSISIAILYPFCGTLLNNIVNPRPPKRSHPHSQMPPVN